jgi:hypothetical protein
MRLALLKWGLGSPSGLPKLQSSIAGIKTPHVDTFLVSLERYRSVMSKMDLHEPFGHLQHKLRQKERPGVKLTI